MIMVFHSFLIFYLKKILRADEMAQWVEVPVAKLADPSSDAENTW